MTTKKKNRRAKKSFEVTFGKTKESNESRGCESRNKKKNKNIKTENWKQSCMWVCV